MGLVNSASISGTDEQPGKIPEPAPFESRERALVLAHFGPIWRALRRFGLSAADADDAAQQVFWSAVQRLDQIEPGRERAFLYGMAANAAFKVRRTLARRREKLTDFDDHVGPQPSSEELLQRRQARELLDRILDALEHDVRVVLVLHEIEQLTAPEIAEALSIPLGTVASRLRRGREQFARRLAQFRNRSGGLR
jgi:RNA polymerase sigma-70 factor (ECF subfamily)